MSSPFPLEVATASSAHARMKPAPVPREVIAFPPIFAPEPPGRKAYKKSFQLTAEDPLFFHGRICEVSSAHLCRRTLTVQSWKRWAMGVTTWRAARTSPVWAGVCTRLAGKVDMLPGWCTLKPMHHTPRAFPHEDVSMADNPEPVIMEEVIDPEGLVALWAALRLRPLASQEYRGGLGGTATSVLMEMQIAIVPKSKILSYKPVFYLSLV